MRRHSTSCAGLAGAASASPASVRAPTSSRKPACSTAASATTHWQRTRHFLKTYPQVKLEPDRIFVRDGDVWTSAGMIGRHRPVAGDDRGRLRRRDRAANRKAARALSPAQRRPVAILLAFGIEGAEQPVRTAVGVGARASRCPAHGGRSRRAGRHEFAAFHPGLHGRDRHHAVKGGGAIGAISRWRGSACSLPARRSSASPKPPAFAIRSGCAAPSSAPSASRRNRCAGLHAGLRAPAENSGSGINPQRGHQA